MRIPASVLCGGFQVLFRGRSASFPAPAKVCRVLASCLHTSPWLCRTAVPGANTRSELAALKERGLFNVTVLQHVKYAGVTSLSIASDGKCLNIEWEDGHESKFHAMWLRHSCHCPECRLDHIGMICAGPEAIDLNVRIINVEVEDNQVLLLRWQHNDGTTHDGPIPLAWLRQRCKSPTVKAEKMKARAMVFHENKTIPEVSYEEVIKSELGVYKWMCHLEERGICLVKNCPEKEGVVSKIAERIAPVQHTIYGETFQVIWERKPLNSANAPVDIALHMDQVMYESAPGIQLLHCVQFDPEIIGGENLFVDIFELAHNLRKEKPDYFDILARVPVLMFTIQYDREYPMHMTCERPLFGLNPDGELITINWNPMTTEINPKEEDIEPFFAAYKYFFHMVKNCQSVYTLRMVRGDCISFNNRRLLHGRTAYTYQKGIRWLQGVYLDSSEFQNRLQIFHNKLGDGRTVRRIGRADWQ